MTTSAGIGLADGGGIRAGGHRPGGGDHPDVPGARRRRGGRARRAAPRRAPAPPRPARTSGSACAVAVLQARTSSFTSWASSQAHRLEGEGAHLVGRARSVRRAGVVAEVDRRFGRQAPTQLGEDGQATDAGVEDADRPRVGVQPHRVGQWRARAAGARGQARADATRPSARIALRDRAHPGLPSTNGTPSLLAAITSRPSDTTS